MIFPLWAWVAGAFAVGSNKDKVSEWMQRFKRPEPPQGKVKAPWDRICPADAHMTDGEKDVLRRVWGDGDVKEMREFLAMLSTHGYPVAAGSIAARVLAQENAAKVTSLADARRKNGAPEAEREIAVKEKGETVNPS